MYEIKTKDSDGYTSYFYSSEYTEQTQDVLLFLGLEVLELNLVDDLDYEFKISELINQPSLYPNEMN